jgi:hypothetical protein
VAVILPVRGADPSLAACLDGLLTQNYPRYDVRIVIDHRADPAGPVVEQAVRLRRVANVQVCFLEPRRQTCSLKLSALVQAVHELDDSYDVVALIDSDVIPHAGWLRDLAAPLLDAHVGATTGIRWFAPQRSNWGTLVRYLWNAAACSQMYAFHIPWGGSLAFRADLVRAPGFLKQWERSLWEDTAAYQAIRDAGLRLRYVPAVTMVNRETIDLKSCFQFIRRQLLNVRLYHPRWPAVVAHGVASVAALAGTAGAFGVSLAARRWEIAACAGAGLATYALGAGLGLAAIEWCLRRRGRRRASLLPLRTLLAVPLTHLVYVACLASASLLRKVGWRGITYRFRGPWDVHMVEYRPYEPARKSRDRNASLI